MPTGEALLMSVLLPQIIVSIFSASLFPPELLDLSAARLDACCDYRLDRTD